MLKSSISLNDLRYKQGYDFGWKKRITKIDQLPNGHFVISCLNGPILIGQNKKWKVFSRNDYNSFFLEENILIAKVSRNHVMTSPRYDGFILDRSKIYPSRFKVPFDELTSKNNNFLKYGEDERTIDLYILENNVRKFVGHSDRVTCCTFYNDDCFLSGSLDKTIKAWDLQTGDCLKTFIGHESSIKLIEVINSKSFLTLSDDDFIKQWDFEKAVCTDSFNDSYNKITYFKFLSCGNLAMGSYNGIINVWSKYPIVEEKRKNNNKFKDFCKSIKSFLV